MRDTASDLAVLALRYAAGDLGPEESAAFEQRLGAEQPAREALAEAIRLSASALGHPLPVPSAEPRSRVRDRLFPTWWTRLFPRRSYRGHPAVWAGLGGTLAAGAAVLAFTLGDGVAPTAPRQGHRALPAVPVAAESTAPSPADGAQAAAPEVQSPVPAPGVPGPRAARPSDPTPMPAGEPSNG